MKVQQQQSSPDGGMNPSDSRVFPASDWRRPSPSG